MASVFAQTFTDWELIIADDGSARESLDYLAKLEGDERVRILRLEHSGNPGKARNAAITAVRTPLVAFLDSDDLWEPDKLRLQLEQLEAQSECAWCYTGFTIVDANDIPLASERHRRWIAHRGRIFEPIVRATASIRVPAVVASTQLLLKAGAFDEAIDCGEDYDLWLRLALLSPVCVVDEPLVRVRRHADNQRGTIGRAHVARDYSLRKLAEKLDGAERAMLLEERSRNASRFAAVLASHGRRRAALSVLAGSLPFSWTYARWWYRAAKTVVRSCALRPAGSTDRGADRS